MPVGIRLHTVGFLELLNGVCAVSLLNIAVNFGMIFVIGKYIEIGDGL